MITTTFSKLTTEERIINNRSYYRKMYEKQGKPNDGILVYRDVE